VAHHPQLYTALCQTSLHLPLAGWRTPSPSTVFRNFYHAQFSTSPPILPHFASTLTQFRPLDVKPDLPSQRGPLTQLWRRRRRRQTSYRAHSSSNLRQCQCRWHRLRRECDLHAYHTLFTLMRMSPVAFINIQSVCPADCRPRWRSSFACRCCQRRRLPRWLAIGCAGRRDDVSKQYISFLFSLTMYQAI